MYIDFLRVQHDLLGRTGNVEIDLDDTLVAPRSTKFQVEKGYIVVNWLCPARLLELKLHRYQINTYDKASRTRPAAYLCLLHPLRVIRMNNVSQGGGDFRC